MHFFPLAIEVLGAYTNKGTTFFTNVPKWHGWQKAPMALLWQFYMPSIGRECWKPCNKCMSFLFWGSLSLQMRALLSLVCFHVSFPFLSFICFLWLVRALKHNLFLWPFVTHFGCLHFWLRLGSSPFVLPCPIGWVLFNKACQVSSCHGCNP
jgi:hypothetical protein